MLSKQEQVLERPVQWTTVYINFSRNICKDRLVEEGEDQDAAWQSVHVFKTVMNTEQNK